MSRQHIVMWCAALVSVLLLGCSCDAGKPAPRDTGPCDLECVPCPEEYGASVYRCNPCDNTSWACDYDRQCEGIAEYQTVWRRWATTCDCIDDDGHRIISERCVGPTTE